MSSDERSERVKAHLDALDDQLARLRALEAELDNRRERRDAELRELRRAVAESSAELRAQLDAQPDD